MHSPEEKKAWFAKMGKLAKKIKSMDENELKQFVRGRPVFTCEGHVLSLRNQAMLLMQSGELHISQVGGFKQWQKIGRRVAAGQHSIGSIMVPMIPKAKEGEVEDVNDDIHFRWVPMFDVAQTEEKTGQDKTGSLFSEAVA